MVDREQPVYSTPHRLPFLLFLYIKHGEGRTYFLQEFFLRWPIHSKSEAYGRKSRRSRPNEKLPNYCGLLEGARRPRIPNWSCPMGRQFCHSAPKTAADVTDTFRNIVYYPGYTSSNMALMEFPRPFVQMTR